MPAAKKSTTPAPAVVQPEPVEELEPEEVQESSETEQEGGEDSVNQALMTSRIKANPSLGKFLIDINDRLKVMFDGIPDLVSLFWGDSVESLNTFMKKANKRKVKEEAKFVPTGLKKPSNALNIFTKKFQEQCKATGTTYSHTAKNEAWGKLSDSEKSVYQKQYEEAKTKYEASLAKQREDAIKNGLFPEDKPKRPLTAYFHYLAEVRPQLAKKYAISDADAKGLSKEDLAAKKKDNNLKISSEAGEMWKKLTDDQKAKYANMYKRDKEVYDTKMAEWTKRDLERRKKNGESVEEEPVIETAGSVSVSDSVNVAAAAAAAAVAAVTAAESKAKKTTTTKAKSK